MPVHQQYLLQARQMQALSFIAHIPLVCFAIAFPLMVMFVEWLHLRSGDVFGQVVQAGCAGDHQHVGVLGQEPGQADWAGVAPSAVAAATTAGCSVTLGIPGKADPRGKYGTHARSCCRHRSRRGSFERSRRL